MAKRFVAGALCGAIAGCVAAAALSLSLAAPNVIGAAGAIPPRPSPEAVPVREPLEPAEIVPAPVVAPPPDTAAPRPDLPQDAAAPGTPPVRFEGRAAIRDVVAPPEPAARRPQPERAVAAGAPVSLADPVADPGAGSTTRIAQPGDRASARLPRIPAGAGNLAAPESGGAEERVAITSEAPVMANRNVAAPQAPRVGREPDVTSQPMQPPAPSAPVSPSGLVAAQDVTGSATEDTSQSLGPSQDRSTSAPAQTGFVTDTTPDTAGRMHGLDAGAKGMATSAFGALARFSVPARIMPGQHGLAVVLVDDGRSPAGPASLKDSALALTIALDPRSPDVAERMRRYRDMGVEVAVLHVDALDLADTLAAVPESVALIAPTRWPGPDNAESIELLRKSGHGLVAQDVSPELRSQAGVAATPVFAELDGQTQDPDAVAEFLERTAARAAETGHVVLLGRLRAATLEGITRWAQRRNGQTVLLPLSAVLNAEPGGKG